MTKDTGGSAFPMLGDNTSRGMTLRDYFAAKVMQSLILAAINSKDVDMLAKGAYEMADAMIRERSK